MAIVADYKLDGIDIDWEYPGMFGDSNMYRAVDKENYTLMFKSLREELDSLATITHKKYQVTTAVGGFTSFINHTEMDKAARYLDYVNIMSYDFKENTDSISGHHTNLYASKGDLTAPSAHKSVQEFIAAGVPAKKIVMGVAFYGKGWLMQDDTNRGLLQKALQPARGGGFTYLKDSVIDKNGFVRYWDSTAKAPYLYQKTGKIFISYDDEESIAYKCRYIKKYKLGGIMFWEYSSDKKGYLLHTIADEFKYTAK